MFKKDDNVKDMILTTDYSCSEEGPTIKTYLSINFFPGVLVGGLSLITFFKIMRQP